MRKVISILILALISNGQVAVATDTQQVRNCVNLKTGKARLIADTVKKCKKTEKLFYFEVPISDVIKGADGSTILSGDNEPKSELGKIGDYYIDNVYKFMYGPKTKDGWGTGFSIVGPTRGYGGGGPQGPKGDKGDTGATGPAGTNGTNGAKGDPGGFGNLGYFYDTSTVNLSNTAQAIPLNTTDVSITNGVSIVSGSRVTIANAGKYNISFSSQLWNSANKACQITIWLKKNGIDVANTSTDLYIGTSTETERQVAAWNFFVNAAASDYFQLFIVTNAACTGAVIHSGNSINTAPQIPGTILTVNQVG